MNKDIGKIISHKNNVTVNIKKHTYTNRKIHPYFARIPYKWIKEAEIIYNNKKNRVGLINEN